MARIILLFAAILTLSIAEFNAQQPAARSESTITISGAVFDSSGSAVSGALVRLERENSTEIKDTETNADGEFSFSLSALGIYHLIAEKQGLRSSAVTATVESTPEQPKIKLILNQPAASKTSGNSPANSLSSPMEFADQPNFTIAGLTDWTAAGGHGSDTSLRTSESLTREALKLKPEDTTAHHAGSSTGARDTSVIETELRAAVAAMPNNFEANLHLGDFYVQQGRLPEAITFLKAANRIIPEDRKAEATLADALCRAGNLDEARSHARALLAKGEDPNLRRLLGEIDEKSGDPLAAVSEFQQAVADEPSEANYFAWGSELLLHRAIWQAQEVFRRGAQAYPKSARMLTALGAALFAGALYDEAALRLCEASDLIPSDSEPYIFMGKIEVAAPNPLPCVEQKLARFVELQPKNSQAIYYHAMAVSKQDSTGSNPRVREQVRSMLTTALAADPSNSDAYFQLGVLSYSQHDYQAAIVYFTRAIQFQPQMSEAHYRLAAAYDHVGEQAKAKEEFEMHDRIEKERAAEVDRERREVKQFIVKVPE